jgi:ELWxxDGT repeat protein
MHNFGSVSSFHVFAGSLYLGNANPMTGGDTLIKIDSAGVATAFQYMGSDLNNAGQIGGFVEFAGDLYFSATTPATGRDLFKISAGGTVTAIDLTNSGSFDAFDLNNNSGFIVFNNELYFTAYNLGGDALYRLNGAGVVTPVLNNGTTMAGVYGGFKIFANDLYFSAVDPANGYELFKLDTGGTLSSYDIKNDGNGNSEAGNPGGFFVFPAAAPTAAAVSVGGRVTTQNGAGLSGATVTLQDENGATSSAITNPFGYYLFSGIQAGRGYTFTAAKKQYGFAPRIVVVNDELTDLDFVATSQ